jgi:hypothetical protein
MDIQVIILCNQTKCVYNTHGKVGVVGNNPEVVVDDNYCTHQAPLIRRYPPIGKTVCKSYWTRINKCNECTNKDCDNCMNIPPEPKNKS